MPSGGSDDLVINTVSAATITMQTGDAASVFSFATAGNGMVSNTGSSLTHPRGASSLRRTTINCI
jgi:hypothetical protein